MSPIGAAGSTVQAGPLTDRHRDVVGARRDGGVQLHRKFADGRDHGELIDAIARRDADAAGRAAHEQTMLSRKRFLDYMKQNVTESMAML
ncbi:hypothetical protein WI28_07190 [Burkholderia diffusa]|uniref:hypothetical protein n=1 Tax=Burkholderia diffusa TaxID=488732 RepID=UPI000756DA1D|nr:hypothetical protein [Burkholderia diffusa]KUZ16540.1 hypothetical protein WI28_07190 [Burkholderia diffusa]